MFLSKLNLRPEFTGLFSAALIANLLLAPSAHAIVLGIKSCGSGPPNFCFNGTVPNSLPPTNLFSFQEDGSGFIDIGPVTLDEIDIDADALAFSLTHGLLAFELQKSGFNTTGSTLIIIDSNTAVASTIGSLLSGRDIRGAVFDLSDTLWALDAASDELLQINPSTGAVVGPPVALMLGGNAFDLSDVTDIAVALDNTFFVADSSDFYTLDILSGALTLVHTDVLQGFAGITFSIGAPEEDLFVNDVNGSEDIFSYAVDSGFSQTTLHENFIPTFNSGRGDLAAAIPEPSSMLLLSLGLVCLLLYGWKLRLSS